MFESLLQNKIELVYTCTGVLKLRINPTTCNSYKSFYFSNNLFESPKWLFLYINIPLIDELQLNDFRYWNDGTAVIFWVYSSSEQSWFLTLSLHILVYMIPNNWSPNQSGQILYLILVVQSQAI